MSLIWNLLKPLSPAEIRQYLLTLKAKVLGCPEEFNMH